MTATSPPTQPDPATLVAEFVERFAFGDRHGAVTRTRELLAAGTSPSQLRRVVERAQIHVGDRWHAGEWTVAQEHMATAIADAVVSALDEVLDPDPAGTAGRVAVVAADGEWHALPARLAAQAFEERGLEVLQLGASCPADELARTLPQLGADALAVSVTMASNLPGAAASVAAGRAAMVPVLLGGRASSPSRAAQLGAHAHAEDVDHGAELVAAWVSGGSPPRPAEPPDQAPTEALRAARTELLDAAFTRAAGSFPELETAPDHTIDRVIEDLGCLLDHTVAAMLVDEPEVLAEQLPWLEALHSGRGLPEGLLATELLAVDDVLAEHPRGRELFHAVRGETAGPPAS